MPKLADLIDPEVPVTRSLLIEIPDEAGELVFHDLLGILMQYVPNCMNDISNTMENSIIEVVEITFGQGGLWIEHVELPASDADEDEMEMGGEWAEIGIPMDEAQALFDRVKAYLVNVQQELRIKDEDWTNVADIIVTGESVKLEYYNEEDLA